MDFSQGNTAFNWENFHNSTQKYSNDLKNNALHCKVTISSIIWNCMSDFENDAFVKRIYLIFRRLNKHTQKKISWCSCTNICDFYTKILDFFSWQALLGKMMQKYSRGPLSGICFPKKPIFVLHNIMYLHM